MGTCGVGGHQGRDDGVGLNGEGMHSYGDSGAVGLGGGCLVLGAAWGHHRGHQGRDTGVECIPMGTMGLGRGCLVLGTSWGHHRGHMGWGDTRVGLNKEGMHSYGNPGAVGLGRGCLAVGT